MNLAATPSSFEENSGTVLQVFVRSRKHLYRAVCTGNLLAVSVGMSFAWSSPVLPKLRKEQYLKHNPFGRLITTEEAAWIGSSLTFGGMFGTFIAGYTTAKIGRKKSLLLNCASPYVVAFLTLSFAKSVPWYYFARVLAGIAQSSIYTVLPMYLAEISEDSIRGSICSSLVNFETFGELITYCMGPYLSVHILSFIIACVNAIVAVMILLFLPESPYYLLSVNNRSKAEKSLMKLRSDTKAGVKSELDFMESLAVGVEEEQGTICDLWKTKASRKAEIITTGITLFQHISGIIPILIYSQDIFDETGCQLPPEIGPMIIAAVQFIASFIVPNLVDRLGRRWMLLISATGMLISESLLGLYFFLKNNGKDVKMLFWLPVSCLVTYIITYIMGFGPLLWTIMGEIFTPHLKTAAFTLGVCLWWMMAFAVSNAFFPLTLAVGMEYTFWMFAGSCFVAIIFTVTCVVETKGKNFQQIQELLNK